MCNFSNVFVWECDHAAPEQRRVSGADRAHDDAVRRRPTPPGDHPHLPLGLGAIDFANTFRELRARTFAVPAILGLGGLSIPSGYGRDTNAAPIASSQFLTHARATITAAPR